MIPVARPDSVSELQSLVRDAASNRESLGIEGGGTHRSFSNCGPMPDQKLDLRGLDEVIDYSPVDLTIAVGAGTTLQRIDDVLGTENQRLPVDGPHRERGTIGGLFASGLGGPRRLRYGALKDMVIGSEIVSSTGDSTKSGGMVVKNVSGYELSRLHHGAHGAFGIVARLNLKVLPRPQARIEVVAAYADPAKAVDIAHSIMVSALDQAAVYIVNGPGEGWTLHVQIEGSDKFVRNQAQRIVRSLGAHGGRVDEIESSSTPAFDSAIDLTSDSDEIVARLSIPASQQAGALLWTARYPYWQTFADIGSGLVYLRVPATAIDLNRITEGTFPTSFLKLPELLREGIDVFGAQDDSSRAVLRRLKQEFDPNRIFNPGQFADFL